MTSKNAIKLLLIPVFMIIMTLEVSSQYYLTGIVRDSSSYIGVPNRMVTISKADSSYSKVIYTNSSGIFYDTINVAFGLHKKFYVSTLDCNQNLVTDSIVSYTTGIGVLDICTGNIPLCHANFQYFQSGNVFKDVLFVNLSSLSADLYEWSFGDGDSSTLKNPNHFYATAGAYQVCLKITDTNINCTSTHCDTALIFPSTSCSNDYTYNANNLFVNFQGNVNNSFPTTYSWDFGDGMPVDTGQVIGHTFIYGGAFRTCLTTVSINPWTSDTCTYVTCKNITVSGPPAVNISGQVFADTNAVDKGIVYLYKYHNGTGDYSLKDSTYIISVPSLNISYYYFQSVPVGKYITKVVLLPSSQYSQLFAPAYHGNTIHWALATPFDLHNPIYDFPINLSEVDYSNGYSSVEGQVLEGTAKAPGDPISNIPIFLMDDDNQLLGYTISDMNGDYDFGTLPYNKYYLYADIINYTIYPSTTTTSEAERVKKEINIYVGNGKVTGISEYYNPISDAKVFPNPAGDFINLELELESNRLFTVKIFNLLGNLVDEPLQDDRFMSGVHQKKINVKHLPVGVYSLVIQEKGLNIKQIKIIIMR